MILYVENPIKTPHTPKQKTNKKPLLELINKFSKVAEHKINM